jgi:DNA-binding MarR family transcriptional regulator
MEAWVSYISGHAALVRRLNAELVEEHGLALNDYEVMLRLWYAPDHQMRRIDLAESVLLTASGITRLLDRLQLAGYVDKAFCATDARVTYAVLTDLGLEKFTAARATHLDGIQRAFGERFSEEEAATLAQLLGRIRLHEQADDPACSASVEPPACG